VRDLEITREMVERRDLSLCLLEKAGYLGLSDGLNDKNQAIELVLSFFGLDQLKRLPRSTQNTSFTGPLSHEEIELLHRCALRFDIRRSG
jgi:hypothetical protein